MDALHHNAVLTLGAGQHLTGLGVLGHIRQHLFVAQHLRVIPVVKLLHTVQDLPLLQPAVSHSGEQGIPVLEAVFLHLGLHIGRL